MSTAGLLAGLAGWAFLAFMITFALMSIRPVDYRFTRREHATLYGVGFLGSTLACGISFAYMTWAVSV